jgi:hypothetical protein
MTGGAIFNIKFGMGVPLKLAMIVTYLNNLLIIDHSTGGKG